MIGLRAAGARARVVLVWLALIAACGLIAARASYVADLSAFLPTAPTPEQRVLLAQVRSGFTARLLLIGIRGGDASMRADASRKLADALRRDADLESVHNGDNSAYEATGRFLFAHRYQLSPGVDSQRFTAAGLRDAFADTIDLLGTPTGSMIKPLIRRDPTGEVVRLSEAMLPATAPRVEDGVWVSRTEPRALLVAATRAEGADLDAQARAIAGVRAAFAQIGMQPLRLELSGQGVFSVDARERIESEVRRLAIAGAAALVVLLLLAFGSLQALVIGGLPVASGIVAGIAAVALVFGHVHGITLGFGSTLIGEAVDYAIYYLIQARPVDGDAQRGCVRWRRDNWPTVRLGLFTSLAGFAALVFSGFPGLAQLGVFSLAGLVAAALTTRFMLPVLAPDGARGRGLRRVLSRVAAAGCRALPRVRWPLAALCLASAGYVVLQPDLWRGNLAGLSPITKQALALDASLRADLGAADTGRLIAIEAPDESTALQRAEAAAHRLDSLVERGRLAGYESPSKLLPSPATQRARQAALPDAATLRARVAEAAQGGVLTADRLEPFIDDVQAQRALPPLTRASLAGTPLAGALAAQLMQQPNGGPWTVLMSLQPSTSASVAPLTKAELQRALTDLPDTRVVEIQPELDDLYAHYLHEALWQSLLGVAAVLAVLLARLRSLRRLARVAWPLAASVVLVLGLAALSGAALGVLHLVGLLLVVAVGSNYALFFDHLRIDPKHVDAPGGAADDDTLASLLLANITIVVSFGLLASSDVPALSAVGRMVAPGALFALLLSAAFIPPRAATPR